MNILTEHLDKYKNGRTTVVRAVIVNAPGKPVVERIVPEYQAPLGDLLDTRDKLMKLRYGWQQPQPWQRVFLWACTMLGLWLVFFAGLAPTTSENWMLARVVLASGAVGTGLATGVTLLLSLFGSPVDKFALDVQLRKVRDALNGASVQWGDGDGDFD